MKKISLGSSWIKDIYWRYWATADNDMDLDEMKMWENMYEIDIKEYFRDLAKDEPCSLPWHKMFNYSDTGQYLHTICAHSSVTH